MGKAAIEVPYPTRIEHREAFGLAGFTKVVRSGGEVYDEARGDGRWAVLRALGGADPTIYGVASVDAACPPGWYRYTLAVLQPDAAAAATDEPLHRMSIARSDWLVFTLDDFMAQYGEFWQHSPYDMCQALGATFNTDLSLHLDVFPPSYGDDHDAMEFWLPICRPAEVVSRRCD